MLARPGGRVRRPDLLLVLAVAAVVPGAAGCGESGRYKLAWTLVEADGPSSAPAACGRHGVSTIAITETNAGGDVSLFVAPCAWMSVNRKLGPGNYTLIVTGRDARGYDKEPPRDPMPVVPLLRATLDNVGVEKDETTELGTVDLVPQPECRDGVDNDCDGRVDILDPACPDGDGPSEAAAGEGCGLPAPLPDAGSSPDSATGADAGADAGAGADADDSADTGAPDAPGTADADPGQG
jgi:hypothetical protein